MFYVVSEDSGFTLRSTENIERGEYFLDLLEGTLTNIRTYTSIQVDEDLHVEHEAARYINHSFAPNCTILDFKLIATEDILAGEDILFDYTMNEDEIAAPFVDKETGRRVGGDPDSTTEALYNDL